MALFVRNALVKLRASEYYERKRAMMSVILNIVSYYPLNYNSYCLNANIPGIAVVVNAENGNLPARKQQQRKVTNRMLKSAKIVLHNCLELNKIKK